MGLRQPMPPQGNPAQAPQASSPQEGGQESAGGAGKVAAAIFSGMNSLMDMMDNSQAVSPEDKKQFAGIVHAYQDFIENNLGQSPGQAPQGPKPMPGPAGMEAGVNPGARPMPQ